MEELHYSDWLVGGVLFLIMFGIGLSLGLRDFVRIFKHPKALLLGLVLQLALLPLLAFAIAASSGLPDGWKVGMLILAACPGGTTSNFISYLVKANVALSISLTGVNCIVTVFSLPLVVNFALGFFMGGQGQPGLPVAAAVANVLLVTVLPVVLGMGARRLNGSFAERVRQPVKLGSSLLLAAVFAIKFLAGEEHGGSGIAGAEVLAILPHVLLLHVASLFMGFAAAVLLRLGRPNAVTIGIEVGLQNTALALLAAGGMLHSPEMSKPALVYALFSFWTALLFGLVANKTLKKHQS